MKQYTVALLGNYTYNYEWGCIRDCVVIRYRMKGRARRGKLEEGRDSVLHEVYTF